MFKALADPTRRSLLDALFEQDGQTLSALEARLPMTRFGVMKHLKVLEEAGLVVTKKVGRVRTCRLGRRRLDEEAAWIERFRRLWAARFDELDHVVDELKQKEKTDERRK